MTQLFPASFVLRASMCLLGCWLALLAPTAMGQVIATSEEGDHVSFIRDYRTYAAITEIRGIGESDPGKMQQVAVVTSPEAFRSIPSPNNLAVFKSTFSGFQSAANGQLYALTYGVSCSGGTPSSFSCQNASRSSFNLSWKNQLISIKPSGNSILGTSPSDGRLSQTGAFAALQIPANGSEPSVRGMYSLSGNGASLVYAISNQDYLPRAINPTVSSNGNMLSLSAKDAGSDAPHWLNFYQIPETGVSSLGAMPIAPHWRFPLSDADPNKRDRRSWVTLAPDGKLAAFLIEEYATEQTRESLIGWRLGILDCRNGKLLEERRFPLIESRNRTPDQIAFSVARRSILVSFAEWDNSNPGGDKGAELTEFPITFLGNLSMPRLLSKAVRGFAVAGKEGSVFILGLDGTVTRDSARRFLQQKLVAPPQAYLMAMPNVVAPGQLLEFRQWQITGANTAKPALLDPALWRFTFETETLPILYPGTNRFFVQLPWVAANHFNQLRALSVTGPDGFSVNMPLGGSVSSVFLPWRILEEEGTAIPIIFRGDFSSRIYADNVVQPGEVLVAAMTGLGRPIQEPPPAGVPGDRPMLLENPILCSVVVDNQLAVRLSPPHITLMPGLVGIYQVNLTLPAPLVGERVRLTCGSGSVTLRIAAQP